VRGGAAREGDRYTTEVTAPEGLTLVIDSTRGREMRLEITSGSTHTLVITTE
jgi:hypothetical protein